MISNKSIESVKLALKKKLFFLKLLKLYRQLYPIYQSSLTQISRKLPRYSNSSMVAIDSELAYPSSYQSHFLGRNLFLLILWKLSQLKKFYVKRRKYKSNVIKQNSSRRFGRFSKYLRWKSDLMSNFVLSYYFRNFKSIAYLNVYSSQSNTIANLSDKFGNVLVRSSGGSVQKGAFKKGMRSKPYPARSVGEFLANFAKESKIKYVFVRYNGIGKKRKSVVRPFKTKKIKVLGVIDLTKFPHNGCRKAHRPRK